MFFGFQKLSYTLPQSLIVVKTITTFSAYKHEYKHKHKFSQGLNTLTHSKINLWANINGYPQGHAKIASIVEGHAHHVS